MSFDRASLRPITQLLPSFILIKAEQARTLALHDTMRALASEIFRQPVEKMAAGTPWPRARAADLRKFLAQRLEKHIEKKLVTLTMLEKIQ